MIASKFSKLQPAQNAQANVVLRNRKSEHITASLKELHWLPVQQRAYFQIAIPNYNTIHTEEPRYLLCIWKTRCKSRTDEGM